LPGRACYLLHLSNGTTQPTHYLNLPPPHRLSHRTFLPLPPLARHSNAPAADGGRQTRGSAHVALLPLLSWRATRSSCFHTCLYLRWTLLPPTTDGHGWVSRTLAGAAPHFHLWMDGNSPPEQLHATAPLLRPARAAPLYSWRRPPRFGRDAPDTWAPGITNALRCAAG